ncbi:MAG: ABC transporter ATP-binding protein [Pirellulaceae bacterium]
MDPKSSSFSRGSHGGIPVSRIQLVEVEKSFADSGGAATTVLAATNLEVGDGQFVALVGPSGCGKSTLLRLVAGLEQATAGQLTVSGERPGSSAAPPLAFVFQDPTLIPWRTAQENVRLPLELRGGLDGEGRQAIADSLNLVGLRAEDHAKYPRMLSGGMRMRVSLARALVTKPQVLLLDEPFAALDDILRNQLNEELLAIWRAQNWTALFVTHNVAEAVFLSQRVLVMGRNPGRIAADLEVPFAYPRTAALRREVAFAQFCGEVTAKLEEVAR